MSLARNLSKFKPSSSGLVETADIADDAVSTDQIANNATINTSGAITTTGAFTSQGIDDNADATAITITSAEAVGIGKSLTPNNYSGYQVVTIGGSDATTGSVLDFEDSNGNIEAEISGTAGRLYLDADPSSATASGFIHLGVDGNQVLKLDDSKNVTIADGNLVIGTAGHGIDFSAVTNAGTMTSELLDAYEEGTWTPTYRTSDGASITVNTYNRQHGRYTRIGRNVFCRFAIGTTSVTFNNGQVDHNSNHRVQMDGLPFTASNDSINGGGVSAVFSSMGSVTTGVGFLINNNSTIISLRNMGDTASYNGNFVDDIYTAQMRSHSSGEGNMLTGQFFYQTE